MVKTLILLFFLGCSIEQSYKSAEKLLEKGKYDTAFKKFKRIAETSKTELGKKAYLKMGDIMRVKRNWSLAIEYYSNALESSDNETVKLAKKGLLFCPAFIPFKEFKTRLVDVETGGRNAIVEYVVIEEKEDSIKIKKNIYAGGKLTGSSIEIIRIDYENTGLTRNNELFLKYPYVENSQWSHGGTKYIIKERGKKTIDGIEREYIIIEEYKRGSGFAYEYIEDIGINAIYQIVGGRYKPFMRSS
ncbi:MAG: hypothetical protein NZ870_04270 [bacterium]|nr:hypothetical protein [bacterium]